MKTIQTVFKVNKKVSLITLLCIMIGITSCSKKDDSVEVPKEEVKLSSDKQITGFRFTGIENNGVTVDIPGEIDDEGKTIALEMPNRTEITALEPVLEISNTATYEPTGPQDFSTPINYTVTAEDGTSSTYLVTVDVALSQKEILLLIAAANPNNTLNWNETDNLSDWDEVTLNGNGDIIELTLNFKGIKILTPEIGLLRSLEVLRLANLFLNSLPPEIGQLSSLEELSLYNNDLESVPTEIGQLTSLTKLNLSDSNLSSLPAEIGQLDNLISLRLSNNNLNSLPIEIGQLTSLESLDLNYNALNNLPAEIGQLSKLEYLSVSNNSLNSLPAEIGLLSNLEFLYLINNNLSSLPAEIGRLSNLKILSLHNNKLSILPTEIGQLSNLEFLYLINNNLSNLPSEIKKLVNLQELNLKDNNLSTFNHLPFIPSGNNSNILDCSTETNLKTLNLSGNPNLTDVNKCICDLDLDNGGAVDIDVVPNEVDCVDSNVIGN